MIITPETPLNVLDANITKLYISKDASLNKHFLELLLQKFPNAEFCIKTVNQSNSSTIGNNVLYNNEELVVLADNVNTSRQKYHKDITFDDEFTIEQAIDASKKLNEWEDYIKNMTIDGKPLSPLEKYTVAYSLVSNRFYNLETKGQQNASISRNLISVLTDDYIVCAGFANTLTALCSRIGIPCTYRLCSVLAEDENKQKSWQWHANCMVKLHDTKYDVNGVFLSDPTWDCLPAEFKDFWACNHNFKFNHLLLTNDDYEQTFPFVALDTIPNGEDENHKPKTRVQIPNLHSLFSETPIYYTANKSFMNKQNGELDCAAIKKEVLKNVCERLDEHLDVADHPDDGEEFIKSTSDFLASYFLNQTLIYQNGTKFELMDYVNSYLMQMLACMPREKAKAMLETSVNKLDNKQILDTYMSTINQTQPEGNYDKYYQMHLFFKHQTKPVKKETFDKLFRTLIPKLYPLEESDDFEQVVNLLMNHSPIATLENAKQKTQNWFLCFSFW